MNLNDIQRMHTSLVIKQVALIYLATFLSAAFSERACAEIRVMVAKHIVQGSGVTTNSFEEWFRIASNNFSSIGITLVQRGPIDTVPAWRSNWVADALNIYAVSNSVGNDPHVSASSEDWVQITGPHHGKTQSDTLKHELGHVFLFNAKTNVLHHSTDPSNFMYPHWAISNGQLVVNGPGRTNHNTTAEQATLLKEGAARLQAMQTAARRGMAQDEVDAEGDVSAAHVDIFHDYLWAREESGIVFEGGIELVELSLTNSAEVGFYFDIDHDKSTGDPIDGLDYFVGYDPATGQSILKRFDGGWLSLDPSGIDGELTYVISDADLPPEERGISLNFALSLLPGHADDYVLFRAAASADGVIDYSPDGGLKRLNIPEPGTATLLLLASLACALVVKRKTAGVRSLHSTK